MPAELQLVGIRESSHSNSYDWRQSGWSGQLGVRLADGTVVALDEKLSMNAWGDYSGSGCSFTTARLWKRPDGWLLHVEGTYSEMYVGDTVTPRSCWQGAPDGRTWTSVPLAQAPAVASLGQPDDELGVPGADREVTR